jgi:hypothetical protein
MPRPHTKDPRLEARRGGRDLEALVGKALDPDYRGRAGAEEEGIWLVRLLAEQFIRGDSDLAVRMRRFVAAMLDRTDPLRKDVKPDQWMALSPAIAALTSAREAYQLEHLERLEEEKRRQGQLDLGAGLKASAGEQPGDGVLGSGSGVSASTEGGV